MKSLTRIAIASLMIIATPALAQDSTGVPSGDVGFTAPADPTTGFIMTENKICRGGPDSKSIICDQDMPTIPAPTAADNMGNHTATTAINVGNYGINNAGEIAGATNVTATGQVTAANIQANAGIVANTNIYAKGSMRADANLNVGGTAYATAYLHNSDRSLKDNIQTIEDPFALLAGIHGSTYTWKSTGEFAYGVVAQDVEKVMPAAVKVTEAGTKAVEYDALLAPMIEAIKQLKAENDNLRADLEALKAAQN